MTTNNDNLKMVKYQLIFFYLVSQCKKKLIIHLQKDLVVKKDPNKSDKFCEIHRCLSYLCDETFSVFLSLENKVSVSKR